MENIVRKTDGKRGLSATIYGIFTRFDREQAHVERTNDNGLACLETVVIGTKAQLSMIIEQMAVVN